MVFIGVNLLAVEGGTIPKQAKATPKQVKATPSPNSFERPLGDIECYIGILHSDRDTGPPGRKQMCPYPYGCGILRYSSVTTDHMCATCTWEGMGCVVCYTPLCSWTDPGYNGTVDTQKPGSQAEATEAPGNTTETVQVVNKTETEDNISGEQEMKKSGTGGIEMSCVLGLLTLLLR